MKLILGMVGMILGSCGIIALLALISYPIYLLIWKISKSEYPIIYSILFAVLFNLVIAIGIGIVFNFIG